MTPKHTHYAVRRTEIGFGENKLTEYAVENDHETCSAAGEPYSPEFIYSFETEREAIECAQQLRKWHRNSFHASYRANGLV